MANEQNLTHVQPGQVLNPNGRPKGSVNRKTILQFFLFDADLDEMGLVKNKPDWYDKAKPKNIYAAATIAMGIKAMGGDPQAYNALNKALGEHLDVETKATVMHIFKPEKVTTDAIEQEAEQLRLRAEKAVEAEVNELEEPARTADLRTPNT